MAERPDFGEITSYKEFASYYWYRAELAALCRKTGIDHTGTKQELLHNIEEYFNGRIVKKQHTPPLAKSAESVGLDTPLLDCGFSFNARFRACFSQLTGTRNFAFTADMAAAWRKVRKEQDRTFTVRDMLDVYHGKSDYAHYDHASCEWNAFLKAFCADKSNRHFRNKLKAAATLWKIVRDSSQAKIYSHELVERYENALQE